MNYDFLTQPGRHTRTPREQLEDAQRAACVHRLETRSTHAADFVILIIAIVGLIGAAVGVFA